MKPTPQQHLSKAEHDLKAYEAIPSGFPEWRATALFYAAVHLVEALTKTEGTSHVCHVERAQTIKKKYAVLWRPYSRLQQESEKGRYLTRRKCSALFSLDAEQVEEQLHQGCLVPIQTFVNARIRKVGAGVPVSK